MARSGASVVLESAMATWLDPLSSTYKPRVRNCRNSLSQAPHASSPRSSCSAPDGCASVTRALGQPAEPCVRSAYLSGATGAEISSWATQRPVSRPSPFPRHHSRKDRHVGYPSRGPVVIGVGGSISNSTGRDGRLPRRAVRPAGHQKHRRRGMRLRGSTADDLQRLAAPDEPFYGAGQPSGGQGAKVGVRLLVGCKILHAAPSCGRLSITPREFGPSLPVGRARRGEAVFRRAGIKSANDNTPFRNNPGSHPQRLGPRRLIRNNSNTPR